MNPLTNLFSSATRSFHKVTAATTATVGKMVEEARQVHLSREQLIKQMSADVENEVLASIAEACIEAGIDTTDELIKPTIEELRKTQTAVRLAAIEREIAFHENEDALAKANQANLNSRIKAVVTARDNELTAQAAAEVAKAEALVRQGKIAAQVALLRSKGNA